MSTINETWRRGEALLKQTGNNSARLDAQVVLCAVLGTDRTSLYAYPERTLSSEQMQSYLRFIERRQQKEPIAYIIGHKEFFGLDFVVDQRVLIPRPETELLVEMALSNIRHRLDVGQVPLVADIGTGSGAIAVAIAVAEPRLAFVYACDISSIALDMARENARRHSVEDRLHLLHGDLVAPLPEPVDILLANLPYVGTDEKPEMTQDVLLYEPHLALFSGSQGLDHLQRFCLDMLRWGLLRSGGAMLLEIGYRQGEAITQYIKALWPSANVSLLKDYAGLDRFVFISMINVC
jgi:release factor glutamine methyltransferase